MDLLLFAGGLTKKLPIKSMIDMEADAPEKAENRPHQPSQHQRANEGPRHRAGEGGVVIVMLELLRHVARSGYAVRQDIVDGLDVERFFDFGVWGDGEVEQY